MFKAIFKWCMRIFDQSLAVLQRTAQQQLRQLGGLFLEFLIPVLFLIVCVILYKAVGQAGSGRKTYLDYDNLGCAMYSYEYVAYMCTIENSSKSVAVVSPCSRYPFDYTCVGTNESMPPGLCYMAFEGTDQTALGITYFWIQQYVTSMGIIPSLDGMYMHQWLARKAQTNIDPLLQLVLDLLPNTAEYSILCSGYLYFVGLAADVKIIDAYFRRVSSVYNLYQPTLAEFYRVSVKEATDSVMKNMTNWGIVEVRSFTPDNFDVALHVNKTALPGSYMIDPNYAGGFSANRAELYVTSGTLTLMQNIAESYFDNLKIPVPDAQYIVPTPSPKYQYSLMISIGGQLVPFIYVLAFLYPATQLTKKMVLEKEMKLRESMLIMGVTYFPLYLSWFLLYFFEFIFVSILITFISKSTLLSNSDPYAFFLIMFMFSLTTIPLCGLMASFFSKARLASLLAPIIYFILAIPVFAIQSANGSVLLGLSVLSPTAFSVALLVFVTHELRGGFRNPEQFTYFQDDPTIAGCLVLMTADIFIYYGFMLYLDAVMPKDWGTPKHPLFFIIDPYRWLCGSARLEGGPDGRDPDGVFEETDYDHGAVVIDGLRKEFKRGGKTFVAVDNLYWGMNEGEISVMLGHNGAGKSTTLNMMTGMLEPDEGDCYIYGLSVRQQLSKVREEIGFCPQHNILWPELTCREHLEFFAKIKGLKGWELEDAVCRILYECGLPEKIESPARRLSGGQKRKLSLAIAFVGLSRLVFLDEPTAGMDVGARRQTWELLRRMSETHSIMLTTHYMDEADLLGHRIGIMSKGRLKCSGSSLFLKSRLGLGYSITISITNSAACDGIDDIVNYHIPSGQLIGMNGCEVSYRLPNDAVDAFPGLLKELDSSQSELGVRGYSLSATTLEEIFVNISREDVEVDHYNGSAADLIWNCEYVDSEKAYWWSQFSAMMKKRFYNGIRDRRMQCFQVICPVICILIAMLLSMINMTSSGELQMTTRNYGTEVMMHTSNCSHFMGSYGATETELNGAYIVPVDLANTKNLSWMMYDTYYSHPMARFGAIRCGDLEINDRYNTSNAVIHLLNSSAYHQAGVNLATFFEALHHNAFGADSIFKFTLIQMPARNVKIITIDALTTVIMGAIVMIPFTFLPSNPISWIVKERECRARHLQNVSGLKFSIYWLTSFLFDMVAYIMSAALVILLFVVFQRKEYIALDRLGATILLLLVYGLTSTFVAYLMSFLFDEHSMAQTVMMALSFAAGFLLVMLVYVLSVLPTTSKVGNVLKWIARLIPSYCVGEGIINLAMLSQVQAVGSPLGVWSMDTIGWVCVYMILELPVFAFLTLFIDHPSRRAGCGKISYDPEGEPEPVSEEDTDVEDERELAKITENRDPGENLVLVVDLKKRYPNGTLAVKNLSFRIMPGEVFGFLGTNGAGKTTAISILCQEFLPTSGRAYICGFDVTKDTEEALQCIGYCPQFDATLDLLTVEEHLYMYAGIRGIVQSQQRPVVVCLLHMCGLIEYRSTLASELSGGNRRKLSFAMSLVGGPRVLFLDEPSAGMDPVARRGLWDAIQRLADNCSVVLTTHHLEEVEALADTVAIMVDGTLRCIGDKTHLKNKYGSGFEMSLRIESMRRRRAVEAFVAECFPDATLNEFRGQRFVYALPPDTFLADVFEVIEREKNFLGITDYSVSQTSIEQVFLRVSGESEENLMV